MIILCFFTTCTPKLNVYKVVGLSDFQPLVDNKQENIPTAEDWESYVPSLEYPDHLPKKVIRLNFHFMNNADSSVNYRWKNVKRYAKDLVYHCHEFLANNKKMILPYQNEIPALPTRYRYELTASEGFEANKGIYNHIDDELYYYLHKGRNSNLGSRKVFEKYSIGADSILNIFLIPHHPDSISSPTYKGGGQQGVALGTSFVKISGLHQRKFNPWANRGNLNHEIGHIFSLGHAWRRDHCADTPEHKNDCFSKTHNGSKCDSLYSNNVMDYNTFQNAWTPCQIARMHLKMSREKSRVRKYVKKTWCNYRPEAYITIRDSIVWTGEKDFNGDIIIESGASLEIRSRMSMPPNGKIYVKKGGKLILNNARLHNDCDKQWKGIFLEKSKKENAEVFYIGEVAVEDTLDGFAMEVSEN